MPHPPPDLPSSVRTELRIGLGIVAVVATAVLGVAVIDAAGGAEETTAPAGAASSSGSLVTLAAVAASTAGGATTDDGASGVGDATDAEIVDDPDGDLVDLVEPLDRTESLEGCRFEGRSVRLGSEGPDVACLQQALVDAGATQVAVTGSFDRATHDAVVALQTERSLFVDGVAGRETALSLDIWRDEEANVIRTPPPPPGAVDLLGFPLSSVATSGPDAPPLPDGSGSGRRLVYERAGQRVWAVDENERVIRSWLVTGSMYDNELRGTHYVYSRSLESTAWNGAARLPKMVRWLQTERGHIGFHGIPTDIRTGEPYQTDAELGSRLSGGSQRQADLDADFVWEFAPEGTKVVVL